MRNVMVRCIFSALSVGICIVGVLGQGQEIHRYQWSSDQQVLADEWKPFVPGFVPRQVENYPPQRPESSRQFFGKLPEPVPVASLQQNLYKKSFQTAASANNLEPFVVPPILGTFNTFGLQTIQARNPLLDKNVKDNQFLDQGSHLHPKYFPQNNQQPQRFPPTFFQPQPPQYLPNQQQHYGNPYRLENPGKPQSLIQAPSKNIPTSVQVFPPNPPNHYQPNNYFLGVPQKQESYEDEGSQQHKQQPLPRPNDFLLNTNNIATIYGTRDPALNIPPPSLKPTHFIRNEQIQDQFLYDGGLKQAPQRYEPASGFNKRPHESQVKQYDLRKPHDDNPSKQVFEQLSQFGRPFTLPREPVREPVTESLRLKPEQNNREFDPHYEITVPVEHYKKEKPKPSHLPPKPAFDRIPPSNYPEVSTTTNLLDYEPGKLQSIKSVTYLPQRDILQFNEEDVSGGVKQDHKNEKYNSFTRGPFLPTPTEAEDDQSYGTFQRLTTPPQKLTSTLPKNHKYFSIQHITNSNRNRYPQNNYNPEPPKYHTTTTEAEQIVYEDKQKYAPMTTQKPFEYESEQTYETTTRKAGGRRRKPSKGSKNKDQVRYKTTPADVSTTSTINENFYAANDVPSTEATIQYTTKKKATKYTTTKPEDDYPNYPQFVKQQDNYPNYPTKQQENYPNYPAKQQDNYPNYPAKQQDNYPNYPTKQQDNYPNYPKEYLQSGLLQNNYDSSNVGSAEYFNSEKEEKENYPQTATSHSTTTTTTPEPTTASLKTRIKNKYATNTTRPRFSVKDYKRTTAASTQSTPQSTTESLEEDLEKKNTRKFAFASRNKNKTTESGKSGEESTPETTRKYKPRTRPPKYRSTTTTQAPDTTTERVNTFKPSASNRQKTSTSKYYSRFRTTTEITSNDAEEPAAASSDKKPVRTMLFSAKRSSVLKPKSTTPKVEENENENVEESEELPAPSVKKPTSLFKPNTKLDKADDASQTNIMTSSEEQNEKKEIAEAAKKATEADKEIDITTSSEEESDDFSSEVIDPKDNEVTTPSSISIVADDRMDDADRVSKVSSLTSLDESADIPISFFQKWSTNGNQKQ